MNKEEIKEIVNKLTPEECYMFMNEITNQSKLVVYGNWYNKEDVKKIIIEKNPSFMRDKRINSVLDDEEFNFDDLYYDLAYYSRDCYEAPDDDFREYILGDFLEW